MKNQTKLLCSFGIIIAAGLFFLSVCHNIQRTQTSAETSRPVVSEETDEISELTPDATVHDLLR